MNEDPVQLLISLLRIYSPSGEEEKISNFLAEKMKDLGFSVQRDEVGNVIAEIGCEKPVILLCGHMDTVPGSIPIRLEDNKLYGRGAVDAKASLAAMISASLQLAKKEPLNKIIIAAVVDEERSSKGVRHLLKNGLSADYAIFGEPSGVDKITIGYKGCIRLKLICKTEAGHSSTPWLFENAIAKTFELYNEIQQIKLPLKKPNSYFNSFSSCLTKINGGKTPSTTPSTCEIYVDIRFPPPFTSQQVLKKVNKKIEQYRSENNKVSIKMKIEFMIDSYEADTSSPLIKSLSWSIRNIRGKSPILLRKTGTGDMNILSKNMNIPIVTYGPGDSRLDHTSNEYIELNEYLESIKVYKATVEKLVDLLNR